MILNPELVDSWHAHVYFNADSRDAAWNLREQVIAHFGDTVDMGRFHERPVGPHPQWSYQIAFAPAALHQVMTWLTLIHGALDVFLHPNTGQSLRDHRDCAAWIGHSHVLNLAALGG
jgi:DOPA 4,5-dioxygenase